MRRCDAGDAVDILRKHGLATHADILESFISRVHGGPPRRRDYISEVKYKLARACEKAIITKVDGLTKLTMPDNDYLSIDAIYLCRDKSKIGYAWMTGSGRGGENNHIITNPRLFLTVSTINAIKEVHDLGIPCYIYFYAGDGSVYMIEYKDIAELEYDERKIGRVVFGDYRKRISSMPHVKITDRVLNGVIGMLWSREWDKAIS